MRRKVPYKVALNSNGRYWLARWWDAQGQRRWESLGPKQGVTAIAAAQLCAQVERKIRLELAGGVPTLATMEARLISGKADVKPATRKLYGDAIGYLLRFAAEQRWPERMRMDELTKQDATNFRNWLMAPERGLGLASVSKHVRALRAVYFLVADELELAMSNPFSKRKWPGQVSVAQDWSEVADAQLRRLLKACPNDGWRCLFALCRWGGLRRGEALRLRVADYNDKLAMITVLPEPSADGARIEGTKQRARYVPARPELAALLEAVARGRGGAARFCQGVPARNIERAIHGGAVSAKKAKKRYRGIYPKAGLPRIYKPLHTLRRNCGTEWAEQGIPITDVARWMGNSVAVAAAYYVRTTPETFARVTGRGKVRGKERSGPGRTTPKKLRK